jgi:hypothetical protein
MQTTHLDKTTPHSKASSSDVPFSLLLIAAREGGILFGSPPMCERKIRAFALMSLLSLSPLSTGAPSPAIHVPEADKFDRRVQELHMAGKYSDAVPIASRVLELGEISRSTRLIIFTDHFVRFTAIGTAKCNANLDCR